MGIKIYFKVEYISKGCLDLIPSPSPSVNLNYGRKSLLDVWRQNIAGRCQQTFESKKFGDVTQKCFALLPQVNFPANDLNFHCRWKMIEIVYLCIWWNSKAISENALPPIVTFLNSLAGLNAWFGVKQIFLPVQFYNNKCAWS